MVCTVRRRQTRELPPVTLLQHVSEINTLRGMTEERERARATGRGGEGGCKPNRKRGKKKAAGSALAARLVSLKAH